MVSLSGARDAIWSVQQSLISDACGLTRLVVSSRDSAARTYRMNLESMDRTIQSAQAQAVPAQKPEHVMKAHRMPILCMDCCTVPANALTNSSLSKFTDSTAAATEDVVALGSAGVLEHCCLALLN